MEKKRIVKDYEKLPDDVISKVKLTYPHGFVNHLISYTNIEGLKVSALPFETEDIYYLIRMTIKEAEKIIKDDDDYDDEGNLREDFSIDEIVPDDLLPDEPMEDDDLDDIPQEMDEDGEEDDEYDM